MDGTGGSGTLATWFSNLLGGGVVVATIIGVVPALAALIAAAWYIIQIYESNTVQRWVGARRVRKLARLKARVLMMEAQSRPSLPGPDGQ